MGNQIITNSMPIGIPGDLTRSGQAIIESFLQSSSAPLTRYGIPFVDAAGFITGVTANDVPANIKGFLVRPNPQYPGVSSDEAFLTATPPVYPAVLAGLKSGHIAVKCLHGTPAKEGKVYVRTAATSSTRLQGGIEAAAAQTVAAGTITGTGEGTLAIVSDGTAKAGTYILTLQTTSQTSLVTVIDPDGHRLKDAIVGTEYKCQGLTFTITAAGTMTAADYFAPVVTNTTIEIPGAFFTGAKDANGTVEVAYNL